MDSIPSLPESPVHPSQAYVASAGEAADAFASTVHLLRRVVESNRPAPFNNTALLVESQRRTLQILATTGSVITVLSTLVAIYWFCMMRKNFRRDLILLLFIGDLCKGFWLIVFSCYNFVQGPVKSGSDFCQATGYLFQSSLELCDYAILVMTIHLYLQIFPWSVVGRDGLYHVRRWVYAAWFLVPHVISALAFTNSGSGYVYGGAFCNLPVRPLWYRLALSWVPRYLIWIFTMFVALRIYLLVGRMFTVFKLIPGSTHSTMSTGAVTARSFSPGSDKLHRKPSPGAHTVQQPSIEPFKASPFSTQVNATTRRASTPDWSQTVKLQAMTLGSKSLPTSRRGSKQVTTFEDIVEEATQDFTPPDPPVTTTQSSHSLRLDTSSDRACLPIIVESQPQHSRVIVDGANDSAAGIVNEKRRAMQRQLRLLFIYPIVYILCWAIPFANHCLNYSNYYAQHPIFAISVLNVICQSTMGFIDVLIFSTREKPWKHITGSDGTFFGSFQFYRFCQLPTWLDWMVPDRKLTMTEMLALRERQSHDDGQRSSLTWHSRRKTSTLSAKSAGSSTTFGRRPHETSGDRSGSLQQQLESERAQQRLALEREDGERSRRELDFQRSHIDTHTIDYAIGSPSPGHALQGKREWWDTTDNEDLFRDDDDDAAPLSRKTSPRWSSR